MTIPSELSSTLAGITGRFVTGCLITALLSVGGVWLVVDLSLRGLETALGVTNQRIADVNDRIKRVEDTLGVVERDIRQGFKEMKQASLTPIENIYPLAANPNAARFRTASSDMVEAHVKFPTSDPIETWTASSSSEERATLASARYGAQIPIHVDRAMVNLVRFTTIQEILREITNGREAHAGEQTCFDETLVCR